MTPPSPFNPAPGFRRGPRIADLMTREYEAFVDSAAAAERAGDAETALEYHQGVPMFRHSAHRVLLTQLADLSDEMTPWLWARWAAYQCTRVEDPDTLGKAISGLALHYTVRIFHADALSRAWEAGDDPAKLLATTMGEDWAYHQICTFELRGLELFLDSMADGRLAEGCALAREWVGATMSGYRVESTGPGGLVVRDLAEDRSVELLDLGAGLLVETGGWAIGRLVPSGTTPALMFDSRPLPVDEETAVAAASGDRRCAWVTVLEHAFAEGRLDRSILQSEDRELVTDVPGLSLLERGTPRNALASAMDQLRGGRDEIGRAAYRILRAVAEGSFGPEEDASYVAAAVLNPHGFAEARTQLVGPVTARPGNTGPGWSRRPPRADSHGWQRSALRPRRSSQVTTWTATPCSDCDAPGLFSLRGGQRRPSCPAPRGRTRRPGGAGPRRGPGRPARRGTSEARAARPRRAASLSTYGARSVQTPWTSRQKIAAPAGPMPLNCCRSRSTSSLRSWSRRRSPPNTSSTTCASPPSWVDVRSSYRR